MAIAEAPESYDLLLKERFDTTPPSSVEMDDNNVLEEIEGDEELRKVFGFARSLVSEEPLELESIERSLSPQQQPESVITDLEQEGAAALSPERAGAANRDWNISPIKELLDLDDNELLDVCDDFKEGGKDKEMDGTIDSAAASGAEKITTPEDPDEELRTSGRVSFPRISDGRSSPILAYSPSLLKSPSSSNSNSTKSRNSNSPTNNGERTQRKPRNIARMLDNISDHSSEEEANLSNVGVMMAKFSVK